MEFSHEELLNELLDVIKPEKWRGDGEFLTREAAKVWGMSKKAARARLGDLADRGVVERCFVNTKDQWSGTIRPYKGWRYVDSKGDGG